MDKKAFKFTASLVATVISKEDAELGKLAQEYILAIIAEKENGGENGTKEAALAILDKFPHTETCSASITSLIASLFRLVSAYAIS